ncbi:TonB-dependent receptor [Novosphingobium fuchskuhlense]|uniref:TonB-dependent receptor n=1 Tax=Novosphingobium fuchskuhlense TaxID=1117702 RepID=A0A124JVQ2_9SPHN|nr:TonB-dependent receptor [Novosphingobium fuchskuhlense]KUR72512.1 TonB-dependent receptor [Novosphingobium fuchskuhlense]
MKRSWVPFVSMLLALPCPSAAQEADGPIIVTAPGDDIDADDATRLGAAALAGPGTPGVLGAIARKVAGASLSDAQGNPWQPNLVFHGFSASALQGNAQGLAVYVDGARFNQPFGDTVNFDLLPDAAIESVTIKDVSPVYGLNALGGVVVAATKTGKTAPGVMLYGAGGRYGRAEGGGEAGWSDGRFSAYAAVQARRDGGWRRYSPSTLYNGYADVGWDGPGAGLHAKWLGADTDLTGNGSAPVELLAADYRAVFTYPDNTRNRYRRFSLHPWAQIGDHLRVEASLYAQWLHQRTLNGDTADVAACEDEHTVLCLSGADDSETPLLDRGGRRIRDSLGGGAYGLLNRSETRSTAEGLLLQLVDRRTLPGGDNELIIGLSHDRGTTRFASSSELGALTPTRSVTGLGPIIAQPDGSITPVRLAVRTRYTGLFLSDRLPLTHRLDAELGLRWNAARIELDDRLGTALDGRHTFRRLNPGIELDYALSPRLSLHAGYAETNRAPTPAELSCADAAAPCSLTNFFVGDPPLRQVVAGSFELGASVQSRGPWTPHWQIAGYRTTSSDDIQFTAAATRGRAYFRNVGRTRRIGFDINAGLSHGPWTFQVGYAFIDATFASPLVLNSPDNPSADANGRIAVRPGARIPGIPRHRATLSAEYAGHGFKLGGDVQAQSGQGLLGDEGGSQPRTDAFAVVGLHGSLHLIGPVTAFAEVTNLFDMRYATFGTFSQTSEVELAEAPGASNPRSLGPGAPRRWMAGLRTTF